MTKEDRDRAEREQFRGQPLPKIGKKPSPIAVATALKKARTANYFAWNRADTEMSFADWLKATGRSAG